MLMLQHQPIIQFLRRCFLITRPIHPPTIQWKNYWTGGHRAKSCGFDFMTNSNDDKKVFLLGAPLTMAHYLPAVTDGSLIQWFITF